MPTQQTDVVGDPFGIHYTDSGLTWRIAKNVSVGGTVAGVAGIVADSTLVNKGTITGGGAAVAFEPAVAGDFVIRNKKSGHIADSFAVIVSGFEGKVHLDNKGTLSGANAAFQVSGSGKVTVNNTGAITAELSGMNIQFATASGSVQIDNAGTIAGGQTGIHTFSAKGVRFAVHNEKGGLISGPGDAAVAVSERLILKNDGKIAGDVYGGMYDDKLVNHGKIAGDVFLGEGRDKASVTAKIDGNLFLGAGDDKLVLKGKGKVTGLIDAGLGNDKVVLGKKADSFLFDSSLDAATNVTAFKHFKSGKDKLFLNEEIFTALAPGKVAPSAFHKGAAAHDADDRIIYDKKSGALYYDPDGTGAAAQVEFAHFDKGTKLKASDFTVGDYSFVA